MKLHYAPQSPFARKVRAAAIELGIGGSIDLEYTEVVPGHPNRTFGQSHNPLRKIPALALDDGTTIYDSTVICEYLDNLAGGGVIIPQHTPMARPHEPRPCARDVRLRHPYPLRNVASAGSIAMVKLDG